MNNKRVLWGALAVALLVPLFGSSQVVLVGQDLHNFLSGLQGGSSEEFYHVNLSEHTEITEWIDDVILLDGGNLTTPGNISVGGYFFGQPLAGSIGSGIINSSSNLLECGCINATDDGVLNVTYPAVTARVWNYGEVIYCDMPSDTVTATDDQHSVYYVNDACEIAVSTWDTYFGQNINPADYARIFDVYAIDGDIEVLKGSAVIGLVDRKTKWNNVNCGAGGHLSICDGIDVQENAFPQINQTSGNYMYVNTVHISSERDSAVNGIHIVTHVGGDWTHLNQSGLNLTHCDDDTDHVACSDNKYRRHVIYSIGFDEAHTTIHQLAPLDGESYANIGDCLDVDATPLSYTLPAVDGGVAIVHHVYCGRRDDTGWTGGWIDIRVGGGNLGATPDTSIFLTTDGTRPLTANWTAEYAIASPWFNGLLNCSNITGATSDLCTIEDANTIWGLNEYYLYNNSDSLDFNETLLNATIAALSDVDTDTNCTAAGSCPTILYADGSVPLAENWPVGGFNVSGVDALNATTLNQGGVSVWDHDGGIPFSNTSFADQDLNQADSPTYAGMSVDNINIDGNIISSAGNIDFQPSGDTDDYLRLETDAAGRVQFRTVGAVELFFRSDRGNENSIFYVMPKGSGTGGWFKAYGTDYIGDTTNWGRLDVGHDAANGIISTANGGSGVAGDVHIFGQGQTARGIAISDDGSHPSIKTVGANTNLKLDPISGWVNVDSTLLFIGNKSIILPQSIGMSTDNVLLVAGGSNGVSIGLSSEGVMGPGIQIDSNAHVRISYLDTGVNEGTPLCVSGNNVLCICGECA